MQHIHEFIDAVKRLVTSAIDETREALYGDTVAKRSEVGRRPSKILKFPSQKTKGAEVE